MTQNELKIFFWLWIVGFRPVNVERKHGVTSCAGYLDHPFLKNDTKQENNQAVLATLNIRSIKMR